MPDVPTIRGAIKTLATTPAWIEGNDGRLFMTAPLDIGGVTVQGLNLRARVFKNRPDEDVLFQLEYEHDPKRRDRAIDRIDWLPVHTHNNKGCGPPAFRFLEQRGSHHHQFDLNWIPLENRLRAENLPIAVPITEEIQDFSALLAFVSKNFRINDITKIEQPGWEPRLL